MKPEYKAEYDALGLPFNYTDLMHPDKEREAFFLESANNYHALKSAVEELREGIRNALTELREMRIEPLYDKIEKRRLREDRRRANAANARFYGHS
jgi:hypothetical protein